MYQTSAVHSSSVLCCADLPNAVQFYPMYHLTCVCLALKGGRLFKMANFWYTREEVIADDCLLYRVDRLQVLFRRQPTNPFDSNAIQVLNVQVCTTTLCSHVML
jgi:hypothetical protein